MFGIEQAVDHATHGIRYGAREEIFREEHERAADVPEHQIGPQEDVECFALAQLDFGQSDVTDHEQGGNDEKRRNIAEHAFGQTVLFPDEVPGSDGCAKKRTGQTEEYAFTTCGDVEAGQTDGKGESIDARCSHDAGFVPAHDVTRGEKAIVDERRRGDAKYDKIRKTVKLDAELAGGLHESRGSAVEFVEQHAPEDHPRGEAEIALGAHADRSKTQEKGQCGERVRDEVAKGRHAPDATSTRGNASKGGELSESRPGIKRISSADPFDARPRF